MKIDKVVVLIVALSVISMVIYISAVLSSDLPWWLKYFLIFR